MQDTLVLQHATQVISVTVVNCTYGNYQKYDTTGEYKSSSFTCVPCSWAQYTMKRKECFTRETGTIANGINNVTILKGYYASETYEGYLTVVIRRVVQHRQTNGVTNFPTACSLTDEHTMQPTTPAPTVAHIVGVGMR